MKGEFTLKLLELISESAGEVGDLLGAFLASGYGASVSRMEYNLANARRKRGNSAEKRKEFFKLQRRYYNLLSWLKEDDLVAEKRKRNSKFFELTPKGWLKLEDLKSRRESSLPRPKYSKLIGEKLVIVTFDIPEPESRKRYWLRSVLKNIDFEMLQKSVWIGKVKIPKELLEDLHKLIISQFVDIFEVSRRGSLRRVDRD